MKKYFDYDCMLRFFVLASVRCCTRVWGRYMYIEWKVKVLQFHSVLRLSWCFLLFLFLSCICYFLTSLRGDYSAGRVVKLGTAIHVARAPTCGACRGRRTLFALRQVRHDSCACSRTWVQRRVSARNAVGRCIGQTGGRFSPFLSLLLLSATLLEQPDSQVLRWVANKIELGQHELYLLDELASAWWLAELYCLNKGWLILVTKDVSSLDLEDVIT